MNYYVDYENVDAVGLEGIDKLTEDDKVIIFYSKKNHRVDLSFLSIFASLKAKFELICSEKTAHNYNDFRIVCECSQLLFTGNDNKAVIISNDKGYTSAQDFFDGLGKHIYLFPDINTAVKKLIKEKTPSKAVSDDIVNTVTTELEDPVENIFTPVYPITSKTKEKKNKKNIPESKQETRRIVSRFYFKKLTPGQEQKLKDLLMTEFKEDQVDFAIKAIRESKTFGILQFSLVEKFGSYGGMLLYDAVIEYGFRNPPKSEDECLTLSI